MHVWKCRHRNAKLDTEWKRFRGLKIQSYRDSKIQRFKDTEIQIYRDLKIQECKDTGIQQLQG